MREHDLDPPTAGSVWAVYHRMKGHNIGAVLGDEDTWNENWVLTHKNKVDVAYADEVVVTVLRCVLNSDNRKTDCVVTLCEGNIVTFSTDWWFSLRPDEYGAKRLS